MGVDDPRCFELVRVPAIVVDRNDVDAVAFGEDTGNLVNTPHHHVRESLAALHAVVSTESVPDFRANSGFSVRSCVLSERYAYQPWLDGLRTVAVAGVLLFHHSQFRPTNGGPWAGGFLGVDVFFVLSGYLITTLLLVEHGREGRISLGGFWLRRARRLLPALVVMIGLVALLAWLVLPEYEYSRLRVESLAALFYIENWTHIENGTTAVAHTWSLAVEEQWYLVWPIAVVAMLRFGRAQLDRMLFAVAGLWIVSVVLMQWLYEPESNGRVYFGTDTRSQSLLLGALLAVGLARLRRPPDTRLVRLLDPLAYIALVGLIAMFWFVDLESAFVYRGGLTLLAVLVLVVITAGLHGAGGMRRILGVAPLPALGKISYGLYLYHWPIFWWLRESRVGYGGIALLALRLSVTFVVAGVSYFLVERPARATISGKAFAIGMPVAVLLAVVAIVAATPTRGNAQQLGRLGVAFASVREDGPSDARRMLLVGDQPVLVMDQVAPIAIDDTWAAAIGSYSCNIGPGRALIGDNAVPALAECRVLLDSFEAAAGAFEPDATVVMVGPSFGADRIVQGRRLLYETDELEEALHDRLDEIRLRTAQGTDVFVVASPPCMPVSNADLDARLAWVGRVLDRYATERDARVVHPREFQCPGGQPRDLIDGPMFEGASLTAEGLRATWTWLVSQV